MPDQLIVITGFMAAGKTRIGRALARRLACEFVDLDHEIAAQQRKTIGEIIAAGGEDSFRQLETKTLASLLPANAELVIALGGGTWARAENRSFLKGHNGRVVWLDAPFDLCWRRIRVGADGRPLAPSREVAEELYRARRPIYELADLKFPISENRSVEECAREIALLLARN